MCLYVASDTSVFILGVRTVKDLLTRTGPTLVRPYLGVSVLLAVLAIGACQPTVKLEAPQEPITINLNIKLDADVRIRLEEQAEDDIQANPDIF